jgi:hypothetical protein
MWRVRMRGTAVVVVVLAVGLAGCFSVDGTVEADGSARFRLTYFLGRHATFDGEARRFTSEHVKLDGGVHGIGNRQATADLRVDDVGKLDSAEAFRTVRVTRVREGGAESLRVLIRNPYDPAQREALANQARDNPAFGGPRVTLVLPGPVLDANAGAQIDGAKVTWQVPIARYAADDELELRVRYTAPAS